jgi:uncharacterized protein YkwD
MRTIILLGLLAPVLLTAQETTPAQAPSALVLRKAQEWMESTDPDRRQAAYRSVHLLGKEALPGFEAALRQATKQHKTRLKDILEGRAGAGNPYRELGTLVEELESERDRVYALIKTDYKKDPDKVAMLRNEMEAIERIYDRAARLARSDPSGLDAAVDSVASILVEFGIQLARFEDLGQDADSAVPIADRKRAALAESYEGDLYLANRQRFAAMAAEVAALETATSHNAQCSWANGSQKDFAAHLNRQRAIMGLGPFRLDEKLSDAATGHSKDMKSAGFFSHTSPIDGKHSPNDRARKAGFQGRWTGENIFMGSSSHLSAYKGWFASDGHRFIMFARGPNVLGIGPVGAHWTLMTGRM